MIDKNKVSGAEMQCKVHRGAEVQKYVQMFSRGDCCSGEAPRLQITAVLLVLLHSNFFYCVQHGK